MKAFGTFKQTLQNVKAIKLFPRLINCQPTLVKQHGGRKIKVQLSSLIRRQVKTI